jgi:putative Holliday junction resolvase
MSQPTGVFLAFDFGLKRIGIAVGQTLTQSSTPLPTLPAKQGIPHWTTCDTLIKKWHPQGLVVGIPVAMDNTPLSVTQAAKDFADSLHQRYQLPVYEADERLSTIEARSQVFEQGGYRALQKTAIDSVAAQVILEGWFADAKIK